MFKVVKKDSSVQDFDRNKVLNSVQKAGGSAETAANVLAQVEAWLPTVAKNEVVKYKDLKSKVLGVLKTLDPMTAHKFETYKK